MEDEAVRELKASVFRLGEDFNCVKVGAIIWDGEQIRAEPAGVREFQEIASRPYWISTPREVKELSPERDPEAWINNLHTRYSSQHIRVSKAG
jgi:hypothetical protein